MNSELDFKLLIPTWLEVAGRVDVDLGLEPAEAFSRAERLLEDLRIHQAPSSTSGADKEHAEVLHALVALVCGDRRVDAEVVLKDVELAFDYISSLSWPASNYLGGREHLLAACSLSGWRLANRFAGWPEIELWRGRITSNRETRKTVEFVLAAPFESNTGKKHQIELGDPSVLLCVCETLRARCEIDPLVASARLEDLFRILLVRRPQPTLAAEHDYLLGEVAFVAAVANRFLFHREATLRWLEEANARFAAVESNAFHLSRVAYQRLALALEERRFEEVLDRAPALAEVFRELRMDEEALKCRFLVGTVHCEKGNARKAIEILSDVLREAKELGSLRLTAQALNNLARFHADLGELEPALLYAREALPALREAGNAVTLVKLRWTTGELLRKQGKHGAALTAYREALSSAVELGIRDDVTAIHLVIADLLLEVGREAEAEWEIRAALPIIDEEKMVPEGIAALSLLRESLRRRQIDKQALRDLHGYFQEK